MAVETGRAERFRVVSCRVGVRLDFLLGNHFLHGGGSSFFEARSPVERDPASGIASETVPVDELWLNGDLGCFRLTELCGASQTTFTKSSNLTLENRVFHPT